MCRVGHRPGATKSTSKSLAKIGGELGVEYLVEGSVRTERLRLRVTSKLIRVRDQVQIWAESYRASPPVDHGLYRITVARQGVDVRDSGSER